MSNLHDFKASALFGVFPGPRLTFSPFGECVWRVFFIYFKWGSVFQSSSCYDRPIKVSLSFGFGVGVVWLGIVL